MASAEFCNWNDTEGVRLVRLWKDNERKRQLGVLEKLQLQVCPNAGQQAWEECRKQLDKAGEGVRVDLPSPRAFAHVLGVFRTAATLKKREAMHTLELAAEDIAKLAGYAKSTVEACLRWLDSGVIEYKGRVVAKGLAIITRVRRHGHAYLEGKLSRVYRTSKTTLSMVGRALLRLASVVTPMKVAIRVPEVREPEPVSVALPVSEEEAKRIMRQARQDYERMLAVIEASSR